MKRYADLEMYKYNNMLQVFSCISATCIINMNVHTFSLSVKIQYHVMAVLLVMVMKNIYTHQYTVLGKLL